ncbi:2-amino-4-hydroxy-6-hydroxymethyldihydropteridine diphosphokinase [candidate division WOR-3 bacterium]|uniref:2-amino-4-hydroxy-6-hydroxymethyldihydropteridine diphosphokinase n=1 Tax=candidate division WOR-3 bacterium TaxID=2052148 RepID=A0A9D5KBB4_UNCW3|nr:2-amino-4-hydroxy-6-hydroxymethyldihydropteridine diphosphokinase [candidate division WOR-3 bacterium]MBD3364626.1 2-amino-4-hydroxy-6-hydroxymethyldihydropteridine diphosphokinase [candidate division WOR-3 bacterium]
MYLSLGSNLGRREKWLRKAFELLEQGGVRILKRSSIYRTLPRDFRLQPSFLNQVLKASTTLSAEDVMHLIRRIEHRIGRFRPFPDSPRKIDIDLLFYNNTIMQTSTLTIPHPRIAVRSFVLVPLAEIAPLLIHPVLKISVLEMLRREGCKGVMRWR